MFLNDLYQMRKHKSFIYIDYRTSDEMLGHISNALGSANVDGVTFSLMTKAFTSAVMAEKNGRSTFTNIINSLKDVKKRP